MGVRDVVDPRNRDGVLGDGRPIGAVVVIEIGSIVIVFILGGRRGGRGGRRGTIVAVLGWRQGRRVVVVILALL